MSAVLVHGETGTEGAICAGDSNAGQGKGPLCAKLRRFPKDCSKNTVRNDKRGVRRLRPAGLLNWQIQVRVSMKSTPCLPACKQNCCESYQRNAAS